MLALLGLVWWAEAVDRDDEARGASRLKSVKRGCEVEAEAAMLRSLATPTDNINWEQSGEREREATVR